MFARILIIIVGAMFCAPLHAASEMRTWTSKDGTATLEAKFHKLEGERITFILPNGRSQYVQTSFLSDDDLAWIQRENSAETAGPSGVPATATIPAALEGNLIDDRGNAASILAADGSAPKHYLFYYSASWCGPCVSFTPTLVKFHRKMKARNASFEVILVPSDRTREDEIAYLKDHRMPWPGVDLDKRTRNLPGNTTGGIPSMVLTDAEGNRVLEVGGSLNRNDFLDEAEALLTKKDDVASR